MIVRRVSTVSVASPEAKAHVVPRRCPFTAVIRLDARTDNAATTNKTSSESVLWFAKGHVIAPLAKTVTTASASEVEPLCTAVTSKASVQLVPLVKTRTARQVPARRSHVPVNRLAIVFRAKLVPTVCVPKVRRLCTAVAMLAVLLAKPVKTSKTSAVCVAHHVKNNVTVRRANAVATGSVTTQRPSPCTAATNLAVRQASSARERVVVAVVVQSRPVSQLVTAHKAKTVAMVSVHGCSQLCTAAPKLAVLQAKLVKTATTSGAPAQAPVVVSRPVTVHKVKTATKANVSGCSQLYTVVPKQGVQHKPLVLTKTTQQANVLVSSVPTPVTVAIKASRVSQAVV